MFCANCGKELKEGEVCTCTQTNEEIIENPPVQKTAAEEAPVEAYYNPEAQQNYYNPEVNNTNYNVFPGAYYDPTQAYNAQNQEPKEKIPARTDYPEGYKIKKKHVAVLLALSFGVFGIHNFYLGNSNRGLAQVLVATVGGLFSFGLATIGVLIWATVEAVLLLTENIDKDSNGYKIQTFEESLAKQINKD